MLRIRLVFRSRAHFLLRQCLSFQQHRRDQWQSDKTTWTQVLCVRQFYPNRQQCATTTVKEVSGVMQRTIFKEFGPRSLFLSKLSPTTTNTVTTLGIKAQMI